MSIGIFCLLPEQFALIYNSCHSLQKVMIDDVEFHLGRLHSKEIIIVKESEEYDKIIRIWQEMFNVSLAVFLGMGVSYLPHLKSGDLMIISEAISQKGQAGEIIYPTDAKLIDKALGIIEQLPDFNAKVVVGKVLIPSDFPDKAVLQSKEEQHNIYCLAERGVVQARAAVEAGVDIFMLNVLGELQEQGIEITEHLLQDVLNQSFWLVKGLIEQA